MRRIALAVLAGSFVLTACSDSTRPTGPSDLRPTMSLDRAACSPSDRFPGGLQAFQDQLPLVFEKQTVIPASNQASTISRLMAQDKQQEAMKQALQFVAWILQRDKQGKVINEGLVNGLISQLLCGVGSSALPNGIDPSAPNVGIGFYDPASKQPTVVKTNNGVAGTEILPGSLKDEDGNPITVAATIVVYRLSDADILNTNLPKYAPFFFYDASFETCSGESCTSQAPTINPQATVGFCLSTSNPPPPSANLRVGHNTNDDGGFEILPLATVPFSLQCSNVGSFTTASLAPAAGFGNLAATAWQTATHALGRAAEAVLLPEPAMALAFGGGTIGGKASSFSPFGVVDIGTPVLSFQVELQNTTQTVGVPLHGYGACSISDPDCPLTIQLSTTQGEGVAGTQVTVALTPVNSETGQLAGTKTVATDAQGIASFGNLTVTAPGYYQLKASAPGVAPVQSEQFCVGDYTTCIVLD